MITNTQGKVIDIFNLTPDDIHIEDIVLALPNICRFGGRVEEHYSVAQHAVELAMWLRKKNLDHLVPHALLHDACETYIGDMIYPIKIMVPRFLELEDTITKVIYSKYGVDWALHKEFDKYDKAIVVNEMHATRIHDREGHLVTHTDGLPDCDIYPWSIQYAREQYARELLICFGDTMFGHID